MHDNNDTVIVQGDWSVLEFCTGIEKTGILRNPTSISVASSIKFFYFNLFVN